MPLAAFAIALAALPQGGEPLHFSYHWHMEQPVYWPDQQSGAPDRYERARCRPPSTATPPSTSGSIW